jgi:hypothetical protein
VSGTIDIDLKEPILAKELQISLVGQERCLLDVSSVPKPELYHCDSKEIVNIKQVVRVYDERGIAAGQYTFPFEVYLPDWLPETLYLRQKSCHDDNGTSEE